MILTHRVGRWTYDKLLTEYIDTRFYRSPECLLPRGRYGKKMDVWAARCVMYQMAIGGLYPLFIGLDSTGQMESIEVVLGRPDHNLLHRFDKFKSDVFHQCYGKTNATVIGTGLQSVYPIYKSGFDVLKDMIVFDPYKRLSAVRLLRKTRDE